VTLIWIGGDRPDQRDGNFHLVQGEGKPTTKGGRRCRSEVLHRPPLQGSPAMVPTRPRRGAPFPSGRKDAAYAVDRQHFLR
jgi:hypothetical protein